LNLLMIEEIDFLSIDINGIALYLLKGLQCISKVISIETNLYWLPLISE